jgi:hypothetical protein
MLLLNGFLRQSNAPFSLAWYLLFIQLEPTTLDTFTSIICYYP